MIQSLYMMNEKTFDCVEQKHKAADIIFQEIKDLTVNEQLEY